jgi:excisionase family DNA binding protein
MTTSQAEDEPSGASTHPTGGAGSGPKRDNDHVVDFALTAEEAAQALHIPYRTCLAAIHSGRLGAVKVGRYYIVPIPEIHRLLASAIQADAA